MVCSLALTVGAMYILRPLRLHLMPPLTTTVNLGTYAGTPDDARRLGWG